MEKQIRAIRRSKAAAFEVLHGEAAGERCAPAHNPLDFAGQAIGVLRRVAFPFWTLDRSRASDARGFLE